MAPGIRQTCLERGKQMRPFEVLLIVTDLLTFCILAIPRLRAMRWLGYLAPITVLVALVQIWVEGPRWQMDPAYALTGLFLLAWLLQNFGRGWADTAARRSRARRFTGGLLTGLGVLGLVLAVASPAILPIFQFPNPGGPYPIGTVTYHWVDTNRHELFSTDPNARRELMAQVWYPAQRSSLPRAPYVQDAAKLSPAIARVLHLPAATFDYWQYVTTNAAQGAPVASDQLTYPVLVYLSGMNGFRQTSTFQVQELVSHGYIVVGIDQPYAAAAVIFPGGRQITGWTRDQMQPLIDQSTSPVTPAPTVNGQSLPNGIIPYFAQDVSFTLDQITALNANDPKGILTGRLDLQQVGTFGVSLGAIVAGEAAHQDPRIRAALMMDAAMPTDVVQAGLRQPSMWITRDASWMRLERQKSGGWSEAAIANTLDTMQAVFKESQPGNGYYVQIPGMFHINFTDAPYWSPIFPALGLVGPINRQRGFDIVNAYSLAFFDHHLKGRRAPLLEGPSKDYPEVSLETR